MQVLKRASQLQAPCKAGCKAIYTDHKGRAGENAPDILVMLDGKGEKNNGEGISDGAVRPAFLKILGNSAEVGRFSLTK